MFIDKAEIIVKAGKGGDGCMSFYRGKYVPRGGPDGGDGGRGGDVYFEANARLRTLLDFVKRPDFPAEPGGAGQSKQCFGKSGEDLILAVPCGTSVYRNGELFADLLKPGERILVAKGGRGGRGNVHFKNSVRQAPRIAEGGEPGETASIRLQLRLIADVGLIGMPNAGKSTLLSRLTRAHPKIANYPFTTLYPNLGVTFVNEREIVFADIPGLIEGSHTGKGLGHEFLQHIERTRVLVHVVDPLGFADKTPKEAIRTINEELKSYSKTLAKKPQIIVVNKQDLAEGEKAFKEIKKLYKKATVLATSGVSGDGIAPLLSAIAKLVGDLPVERPRAVIKKPLHFKLEPDFWVETAKVGEPAETVYYVRGTKIEKLIAMTKFNLPEAVQRTVNIMRKLGVERKLVASGAKPGDLVTIGTYEFAFEPQASDMDVRGEWKRKGNRE